MCYCCRWNEYNYLSLVIKYASKHEILIANTINYVGLFGSPLISLLNSHLHHCNQDWLNLVLNKTFEATPNKKATVNQETLKEALAMCKRNGKSAQIISQYATRIGKNVE